MCYDTKPERMEPMPLAAALLRLSGSITQEEIRQLAIQAAATIRDLYDSNERLRDALLRKQQTLGAD
jgi:hypothetical protein